MQLVEPWGDGPPAGRWTRDRATLILERRHEERTLLIDMECQNPFGRTRCRIAVNGVTVGEIQTRNDRVIEHFDLPASPARL